MPLKEEFYKRFKIPEHPSSIYNEEEREEIKHEIYHRLQQSIDRQQPTDRKRIIRFWPIRYKAAAVLVGVCTFLFIGYKYYAKEDRKTEYITVQAHKGQILEVLLPDHSTVTLNAASIIRYPAKFINSRDVYLEEGEAYFDVAHDVSKPFMVHTGGIITKVLGTAFDIKSYKELPNITVTVTRGSVQVNKNAKTLNTLRPDEQLTFNRSTHKAITQKVKSANTVTWTQGDFNLDGVYFKEIMLAIENRFSIKAIYDPRVFNNCENSIRFTKKQSLTDVLQVLKAIQPIYYSIKKDSVFISGKPCY
jgi:transmembrane sensor